MIDFLLSGRPLIGTKFIEIDVKDYYHPMLAKHYENKGVEKIVPPGGNYAYLTREEIGILKSSIKKLTNMEDPLGFLMEFITWLDKLYEGGFDMWYYTS